LGFCCNIRERAEAAGGGLWVYWDWTDVFTLVLKKGIGYWELVLFQYCHRPPSNSWSCSLFLLLALSYVESFVFFFLLLLLKLLSFAWCTFSKYIVVQQRAGCRRDGRGGGGRYLFIFYFFVQSWLAQWLFI